MHKNFSGIFLLGGCASFGHSCYGGIGKRAETNEEIMQNNMQDTEDTAYVFSGKFELYILTEIYFCRI